MRLEREELRPGCPPPRGLSSGTPRPDARGPEDRSCRIAAAPGNAEGSRLRSLPSLVLRAEMSRSRSGAWQGQEGDSAWESWLRLARCRYFPTTTYPTPFRFSIFVPNGSESLIRSSRIFFRNSGSASSGRPRWLGGLPNPSEIGWSDELDERLALEPRHGDDRFQNRRVGRKAAGVVGVPPVVEIRDVGAGAEIVALVVLARQPLQRLVLEDEVAEAVEDRLALVDFDPRSTCGPWPTNTSAPASIIARAKVTRNSAGTSRPPWPPS